MEESAAGTVNDNQYTKAQAELFLSLAGKSLLHLWKSHFRVV